MKTTLADSRMKPSESSPVPQAAAITPPAEGVQQPMIEVENLDFYYGAAQALHNINLQIQANQVTALIGPSGCGKSTLLRCFNRMNDLVDVARIANGQIRIHGIDIHHPDVDVIALRRQV